MAVTTRQAYTSTSKGGIRFDSVPMRLFQKAKKLGIWDPADIDLTQDRKDWAASTDLEREFGLRLISLFQAGEEAVTLDLLPLIGAVARDGRLEEEIYLTSFRWQEAKHTELFLRWLNEGAEAEEDLQHYRKTSCP